MKNPTKIAAIPLELAAANEFVANLHRHHDPVYRDKFRVGALVTVNWSVWSKLVDLYHDTLTTAKI